jgi:hypothetical protein
MVRRSTELNVAAWTQAYPAAHPSSEQGGGHRLVHFRRISRGAGMSPSLRSRSCLVRDDSRLQCSNGPMVVDHSAIGGMRSRTRMNHYPVTTQLGPFNDP